MNEAAPLALDAPARSAGDVREGRAWTSGQRAKNALLYAAIRGALAITTRLPPRVLRSFGRGLGFLARHLARGARATAEANLARALPSLEDAAREALLARSYARLGEQLGDAVAALGGADLPLLPFDDASRATLLGALAEGRGCLFVSAHLGPWEAVARTLVASGFPLTTLARESYDPRLTSLYDRLRGGGGVTTIYRGAPGAATRIVRTLKSGGLLGVPMDLKSRVPSIDVDFLGHPAPTPVGPARIALRTGAAIVVGTPEPAEDGTLRLSITKVATRDLSVNDAPALTERLNRELSRRILAFPEGWVWMHPRWDDRAFGPPKDEETR